MYHQRRLLIGFFFITFLLEICFCLLVKQIQNLPLVFYISISLFASGLFTILLYKTIQKRSYREFYSDHLATKEIRYTINSQGINYQSGRSHVYIEWENIIKGYEHNDMFCLYISNMKAILLPKRYFESNDDISSFKKLISENSNKINLKK
ncbi:YcxB family protein [Gracilibacillus massiliensis]|uniref:YcxB family protein n=1 Tax=Gracilibacillus massiliensis TaxID=1564956 RepID=UPI0037098C76